MCGELARGRERRQHVVAEVTEAGRNALQYGRLEVIRACVDQSRAAILLEAGHALPVQHDAAATGARVRVALRIEHRDRRERAARPVGPQLRTQIEAHEIVTVYDERRFHPLGFQQLPRAGRAEQLGLERVNDGHTRYRRTDPLAHEAGLFVHVHPDPLRSQRGYPAERMGERRHTVHVHERLRHAARSRAEARPPARGEDERLHTLTTAPPTTCSRIYAIDRSKPSRNGTRGSQPRARARVMSAHVRSASPGCSALRNGVADVPSKAWISCRISLTE